MTLDAVATPVIARRRASAGSGCSTSASRSSRSWSARRCWRRGSRPTTRPPRASTRSGCRRARRTGWAPTSSAVTCCRASSPVHGRPCSGSIALLALATALGVLIGITAAWHRGWVDSLLARVTDVMFAFPGLLFVIMIIAVFDSGAGHGRHRHGPGLRAGRSRSSPGRSPWRRWRGRTSTPTGCRASAGSGCAGVTCCPTCCRRCVGYLVVLFGEGLMSLASAQLPRLRFAAAQLGLGPHGRGEPGRGDPGRPRPGRSSRL